MSVTNLLNSKSIKTRFLSSLSMNILRSMLNFAGGLFIARGLSPAGYGDLMFLLGTFIAIRSLTDLGSSNAFFTFISQRPRSKYFMAAYFSWLGFQFIIIILMILIIPNQWAEQIWLVHPRSIIILAFISSYLQQQVWQTVGQIGEASRKTVKVQTMGLILAVIHIIFTVVLFYSKSLSILIVLYLFILEYFVMTTWSFWFLRDNGISIESMQNRKEPIFNLKSLIIEFWIYCKPLIILSVATFFFQFSDRWILQRFGGANQQGFYQISYQFAAVSLIATTSILNIFWKEIAEAKEKGNNEKVHYLYKKVNRGLFMIGAVLSGFLIPWSSQVIKLFLGNAYGDATIVMAIMFLYPIHQSMGQIGGTMLLATGKTKVFTSIGITSMILSIPISYFLLAPASDMIPGLGLGALGLAIKMVVMNIIFANVQGWLIAKNNRWSFDWIFQIVGILSVILLGYITKEIALSALNPEFFGLFTPFILGGFMYLLAIVVFISKMPWVAGLEKEEVKRVLLRAKLIFRKTKVME